MIGLHADQEAGVLSALAKMRKGKKHKGKAKEDMADGGGVSPWCVVSSFNELGRCLTILKEAL